MTDKTCGTCSWWHQDDPKDSMGYCDKLTTNNCIEGHIGCCQGILYDCYTDKAFGCVHHRRRK